MAGTYPSLTSVRPTRYREEPREYLGDKTVYQDGGADTRSYSDTPIRRWRIIYENLTTAEADQFTTLANNNKYSPREGSLLGFDFTPRGESSLGNVRFDEGGFERDSSKSWIHTVTVRLIRRP